MSQKWNLQDIRPAEPRRKKRPQTSSDETATDESGPSIPVRDDRRKHTRSIVIAVVSLIVVIVGIFGVGSVMSGAEITVYPRHREPNINTLITAYPEKRDNELTYETMTLEASGERQVTATGEEQVQTQATGVIEIIKDTPGSERLVANTRFESPSGLIYRIEDSVLVPGAVTNENDETVPGTVRVEIFAEEPGKEYNVESGTRFSIPGFAEADLDTLFENVYAESRTAIDGGFAGSRFTVQEEERKKARQQLQEELRDALLSRMDSEKPGNHVLFPDAVSFTYQAAEPVEYPEDQDLVTIKESATLQIPIFAKDELASFIAEATVPGYENNPVRIDNYDQLTFEYDTATTSQNRIDTLNSLEFTLSGKPLLVWTFDQKEFVNEISGEAKDALRLVITEYPAIERAQGEIQPFWRQSYPEDTNLIKVTEVLEED